MFNNPQESHKHSLNTLNAFYEYDDFMESVGTLLDLGCGSGLDLEWWATRTTRDDEPLPLNIQCQGVDIVDSRIAAKTAKFQLVDFEQHIYPPKQNFDILWSHDAFQYCIDPIGTLSKWWNITSKDGMLVLIFPQTSNIEQRKLAFTQQDGCYYHHSLVSLIHMLAVSGWDCRNGFFKKSPTDQWLHAVVYKSNHAPMDPKTTKWHDLVDKKLLPETAEQSVMKYGFVDQRDLVLTWLDKNLTWYGK